jgi:hypothetical protein
MMTQTQAEALALRALAYVAGHEDLLPAFAAATGAGPDDFRQRIDEPSFLASVLEFLTQEDRWVVGFCDAEGIAYTQPLQALAALPGGRRDEWP